MSEDLQLRLAAVQKAISKRLPFVSGTLDVPVSDLKLYFGEVDDAYCLNFARATEEQLAKLAAACDPASFGVNKEDVLDESYSKAGKLDTDKFASLPKVAEYGLIDTVRDELLLEGADSMKQVACELYKLNVYGKDSFYKSNKDTPRSERMFGSLVIVLPTPHEGGALVLREDGRGWLFDYAAEIANSTKIAYVAFPGEREHDVLTVQSGYCITLTYNLYSDAAPAPIPLGSKPIPRSVAVEDARLRAALQKLLQVPSLLPNGGYLAFGLRYKYPCDQDTGLSDLLPQLKGADAMVHRACQALEIEGQLKVAYRQDDIDGDRDDVFIIRNGFFGDCCIPPGQNFDSMLFECDSELIRAMGSKLIEEYAGEDQTDDGAEEVLWVTPFNEYTSVKESYGMLLPFTCA
uniref:Prolyl 4-hydroxylase alpha subunit Fe(2+) 2OG dioxygenase domain-containing protein n=1 Tax=Schizophyllum commune (strain H4-8 / FGSC 9210) TaxID=578458 RepID=D8Q148_SCHCM